MSVSPKVFLCPHTMARVARCVPVPASKTVLMPVSPEVFLCLQTTARVARCVPVPVYIVLMPVFQRLFLCPSLVIIVVFWTDRKTLHDHFFGRECNAKIRFFLESISGHCGLLRKIFYFGQSSVPPPKSSIYLSHVWG